MNTINKVIYHLFTTRWTDDLCNAPIEDMRKQLYKNLKDQVNGFWSGHSAYRIMIDGGFLVDAERKYIEETNKCEGKKLTAFGELFMESYKLGLVT